MEMTKWFDANYHYIVPEFEPGQIFSLHPEKLMGELREAHELGIPARPVLLGPITFLLLGKVAAGPAERAVAPARPLAALRRAVGPARC